jgi:hypothetical protein
MPKSNPFIIPLWNRFSWIRMSLLAGLIGVAIAYMIWMPGESFNGPAVPLSEHEAGLRESLRHDVEILAGEIGERNLTEYPNLLAAADFLEASFAEMGYTVSRQGYVSEGLAVDNLEVEIKGDGRADEIVVIGAHYDSVEGSPGANDNGTGTAALLALARSFVGQHPSRTLRFVAFVNEEPPYYYTSDMGSWVYARRSRERNEKIVSMLSLETIGYYAEAEGSQQYPFPFSFFYPSTGNFVAFVGNLRSRGLVSKVVRAFRENASFPSEGAAPWGSIEGVGWSDHWSFWQEGYQAVMVTDTALFRYPEYHTSRDTSDKVQYDDLARVVAGLERVVADLLGLHSKD